jgi:hypothetical protein
MSAGVFAGTYTWEGTTGNFDDLTSWDPDVVAWTTSDRVKFASADTDVTMNTAHDFSGGEFDLYGGATLRLVDGADLSLRKLYLGDGGVGNLIQTGGAFTLDNDYCYIGDGGGVGNYTISGGSFYAKKLGISNSTGTFTVVGDAMTQLSTDRLYLGRDKDGNVGTATLDFQVAATGVTPIGIEGDDFYIESTANLLVSTTAILGTDDIVLFNNLRDNKPIKGSGVFGSLNGGSAAEGTQITLGGNLYELTYAYDISGNAANDVALVYVPEPTTMLLMGLGGLLFLKKR